MTAIKTATKLIGALVMRPNVHNEKRALLLRVSFSIVLLGGI